MDAPRHVLIAGSGAASLTAALLFAKAGSHVTVAEAAPHIGGAMRGFHRDGLLFDTGFHFTGGMDDGGAFDRLLKLLGIRDELETESVRTRFHFADTGRSWVLPRGRDAVRDFLAEGFPSMREGIFRYFEEEQGVFERTALLTSLRVDSFGFVPGADNVTLAEKLAALGVEGECAAILSAFMTCYGTPPDEISFADHARICRNMFDGLVRFRGGGQALVDAMIRKAISCGVEFRVAAGVVALGGVERGCASHAFLSNGERISFDACVLGVHPATILHLLPEDRRGILPERLAEMHESNGLFTAYFRIKGDEPTSAEFCASFADDDIGSIYRGRGFESAGFMTARDRNDGMLITFQCEDESDPVPDRGPEYDLFKRRHLEQVTRLILRMRPDLENRLVPLATATSRTCRDWLHSPFGSAYGIRHEIGKPGVFGRLPVRNCYAVGQNALLPGVLGAALSSVALFQKLCGPDLFSEMELK